MKSVRVVFCFFLYFGLSFFFIPFAESNTTIVDALGRKVGIAESVNTVICSGSGCLRLLTYLQAQDMIVGVDDMETRDSEFDVRPYALANPQFKSMPLFGAFRGQDNPELILSLSPQPQVILKTFSSSIGYDPAELQQKTGIPVVALNYGDLGKRRADLYSTLRILGKIVGKEKRAEEVIAFFEDSIGDLRKKTAQTRKAKRPGVFIGGVAFRGARGFHSTEPLYPPFLFVNARNLAHDNTVSKSNKLSHSDIAKEKIIEWNPDLLFLDLSTLQLGNSAGGLYELQNDISYRSLTAVRDQKVWGLLPYNWYTKNYGTVLANSFFVGKLLYPDQFEDIDPIVKADEIYTFLVGKPVFGKMNAILKHMAYAPIPVN